MPAPNTLIGRILGGYVLQSQIGSGGMGVVFRAHDDRLGRTVAIKVLAAKYNKDDVLRQRFLREGRTAARIDHPNVARILSAGEEGDLPYLVMEYVDGGSLQRILEKRVHLPATTVVRIVRQIAEALAAAHRVGVLHRDVKPANVLFTKDGEPKLVDFGLAREEMSDVNLSQTGMVMGTPHYMAPEVCEGKKADVRADVYALGVVLYAMLALRLPFDAETAIGILMAHIQKPVPPIPEAPKGVLAVLMKSLEKNPAKRWATAAEFAAALARVEEAPGEAIAMEPAAGIPGTLSSPIATSRPLSAGTPQRAGDAPSVPLGSTPAGAASVPGGLLPTEATPSSGFPARRKGPAVAVLAASGALALLLLAGGIYAARRPAPADPAPVQPTLPALPVGVTPPAPPDEAWEGSLRSALAEAKAFEARDDFRRALEVLASLTPPDTRAAAALAREKNDLLNRVEVRVQTEKSAPQRGAQAATRLRELAKKFPDSAARTFHALADAAAQDWQPRDGYPALRALFASRVPDAIEQTLSRLEPPTREDERASLRAAARSLGRLRSLLKHAAAWCRRHQGTVVTFKKSDGSLVSGNLQSVGDRELFLADGKIQVTVGLQDVLMSELAARALAGCAPDDLVLAAVDATLLCDPPGEAWPFALRARRRGLTLDPELEKMLREQIPQERREEAGELMIKVEKLRDNPVAALPKLRDWLTRFDAIPLNARMAEEAREAVRVAACPAMAEDVRLYAAADVGGKDADLSLRWNDVESVLADFGAISRARAVAGEVSALEPVAGSACLVLRGLDWSAVEFEAEVRTSGAFALLAGWRSVFEHFSVAIHPTGQGSIRVRPPGLGDAWEIPAPQDGWVRVFISLQDGHLRVTVGSRSADCEVPASWRGEIGLWFKAPFEFRRLEARGRAEFREPDLDVEFGALEKIGNRALKTVKSGWKDWSHLASPKGKLEIVGGDEWTRIRPAQWPAGDNYRMRFRVQAGEGSEMSIGLRAGEASREVLLMDESLSGFAGDGKFLIAGVGLPLPRGQDSVVDIIVHGNRATVQVGRATWCGHLDPLDHGGIEIGVRNGKVAFGELKLEQLPD